MKHSVIAIIAAVLWFSLPGYANSYSLIGDQPVNAPLSAQVAGMPAGFPAVWRSRAVVLNPVIASSNVLVPGDVITINLFADTVLTSVVDRVSKNVNGTVTVRGRIDGYTLGYVIISTTNGNSLASIQIPETGERYRIQMDTLTGTHYVLEENIDQLNELEDGPTPIPPTTQQMVVMTDTPIADSPLDSANIDVMIGYTPAAQQWADSSGGGIANVVAQAVAKGQLALDNSNTIMTITLVYSGEVTYMESGSSSTDLDRLTSTSDGYMDSVHTLRNQYHADVVGLFTKVEDTGGIGWLLTTSSGNQSYAFSISRVQQVGWTYTYIHEMGHNMGCHHRKDQTTQPGPGLFSYSAGWHWIGTDSGQYCSVMSYEDGGYSTVAYFSNPSINYQGIPTGNATDGDNARTLREIKDVIAAYRQPTGSLNVIISPQGAIDAGARWRRVGTTSWFSSSSTETDVAVGVYDVEFETISEWSTPANISVTITADQVTSASGTYIQSSSGTITIGTGTSSWRYPLASSYDDTRTQTIYYSSEIGSARTLTSLALDVTTKPGQTLTNFTIRLKYTNLSAYTIDAWESTDWTTVYQADQAIPITGWTTFTFTTPFSYDGMQNLMVDICFNNSSSTSDGKCRYSTPGGTRSIYYRTDSSYGDPLTWSGISSPIPSSSTNVPNIRFGYELSTIETPIFAPDAGSYYFGQQVAVTCATAGSIIRYTTDGNDPSEINGTVISSGASVTLNQNCTLKAKAWASGMIESAIKNASYQLFFPGDVTRDGKVDMVDFAGFAAHWFETGCSSTDWCGNSDITQDSEVNFSDLEEFVFDWLEGI